MNKKLLSGIFLVFSIQMFMFTLVFAGTTTYKHFCQYPGCSAVATYGRYCSGHVCRYKGVGNCNNPVVKGTTRCSEHAFEPANASKSRYGKYNSLRSSSVYKKICAKSGCYNKVYGSGSCCSRHSYSTSYGKGSSNNYGKSHNSYTKHKSYDMPDCDDYEDYDEFMDDWDGYMPDGSDAEDYWDNW